MSIIARWVQSLGGFAQKQQLVALGASDRMLTFAVRSGSVQRARQGWYATVPPSDPSFHAVRCGGRLTGLSALRALGAWVLHPRGPLQVSVPENAARLRSPIDRRARLTARRRFGVVVHWDPDLVISRGTAHAVDLRDALVRVIRDESLEVAIAALDWALHTGALTHSGLGEVIDALPRRLTFVREWVDPRCESLPESLARTRLRLAGHHVVSQRRLPNRQRIDLVIDGVVGLETDGEEHHADRFVTDRRKDMHIALAHYVPLRIPAALVFWEWPLALAAIRATLGIRVGVANSGLPHAEPP